MSVKSRNVDGGLIGGVISGQTAKVVTPQGKRVFEYTHFSTSERFINSKVGGWFVNSWIGKKLFSRDTIQFNQERYRAIKSFETFVNSARSSVPEEQQASFDNFVESKLDQIRSNARDGQDTIEGYQGHIESSFPIILTTRLKQTKVAMDDVRGKINQGLQKLSLGDSEKLNQELEEVERTSSNDQSLVKIRDTGDLDVFQFTRALKNMNNPEFQPKGELFLQLKETEKHLHALMFGYKQIQEKVDLMERKRIS